MKNVKEIEDLLKIGEGETLEFKTSFNNELIETLVAFANTNGGKVVVGINQKNNELTGVEIHEESVQNWINEIKTKTSPSLIPDTYIIEFKNKKFIIFSIQEYPIKPVATRGKYFKRIANSNHLFSLSEVVNLHLQSFNTSWDYHINDQIIIDDISFEKVQKAIELFNQSGSQINDDPLTFLVKNDLVRNGQVSNAAFLLFTKKETLFTTIELGRFQTEIIIKDSDRSKKDLLTQIEQVMNYVKKHINKEIIITGKPQNVQKWEYPLEAIREIVINMIIHRDYRSSSDSIVKIFDEKIEFYNPGRLPESITVNDLLTNNYKSTPRNKLIADFCKSIGLIEKYGSGIRRIVEYFNEARLPQPEFRNISEGFMVTVFSSINKGEKENVVESVVENVVENVVEDRSDKIINLIKQNKQISAKQIAKLFNITERTAQRDLDKLKKQNKIKRIGSDKAGHWEVIE